MIDEKVKNEAIQFLLEELTNKYNIEESKAMAMIKNSVFYSMLVNNDPDALYYTTRQWARHIVKKQAKIDKLK